MATVRVGIVGTGQIVLQNHLPGLALAPDCRLAALCDANPAVLERAAAQTGIAMAHCYSDYQAMLAAEPLDALVIATPNIAHAPIALAAIAARKHVLCEKPLALDYPSALTMYQAAQAANVRHMTAFTYRFVPAMRYMHHLIASGAIGTPRHFRASRFQDWDGRPLGWRQSRAMAGSGELGDMLSHRLDYGYFLVGPIRRLVARLRNFLPARPPSSNQPSDVDDFVSVLADFDPPADATGVLESTKLATGRGEGARSHDYCEVNGTEGSLAYQLAQPQSLQLARKTDQGFATIPVPREFLVWPGSPRDPAAGDPLISFRYDQTVEFITAIHQQRPCVPSFREGAQVQAAMDAIVRSDREARWVDVPHVP